MKIFKILQEAVDHMKQLDKIEDKDIRLNKEPNEGLKLYVNQRLSR